MPSSDDDPYSYYPKAVAALNNDEFITASTLCKTAGDTLERNAFFDEAAVAYDLLGLVHYRSGALKDSESSYLKSLMLADQAGKTSNLEYAKTCNSLGAVLSAIGDYPRATDWLLKSLSIREKFQDKPGLISSYQQLGMIEQARSNLEGARHWYEKAVSLEKTEGDVAGLVTTVRWLASTMGDEANPEAVDDIYRIATDAIGKTGDVMLAKTAAEQARKEYDFRAATEFYRKAYEMAAAGEPSNKTSRQTNIMKRIRRLW
ncbi:tetratricopeptide repeat protein [Novipirellula sp. SH528]|uniref:tetratricopeptide repeat protein n=1 Tax=Novipirellula sp. SH528 TaxID=3454466 RepID=UPI003FA05804